MFDSECLIALAFSSASLAALYSAAIGCLQVIIPFLTAVFLCLKIRRAWRNRNLQERDDL